MTRRPAVLLLLTVLVAGALGGAVTVAATRHAATLRIGAVFPQRGPALPLARQQQLGVEIARDLANADGGVDGRQIELDVQEVTTTDDARPAIARLKADGVTAVVGAYSSDLSVPASAAAAAQGMLYWEAGAVADRLTGRGLPLVFRVGADGRTLGGNSARFAAGQLASRLGIPPGRMRMSLVVADDDYAHSVADAAAATARAAGITVASTSVYSLINPQWDRVIADVRAARPDVLVLASHISDGVAFRRAFIAAGVHVGAFIGSTMAECDPEFGELAGADAVGVFASDRPGAGFDPASLPAGARAVYDRLAAEWAERAGGVPTEEGLSGFSAAWALFHHVLPAAAGAGALTPEGIAAAARGVDLPEGSLPNGAGLRFSHDAGRLGQNLRSAAVIWQWQAIRHSVVVWPPAYRTGSITLVPLPR